MDDPPAKGAGGVQRQHAAAGSRQSWWRSMMRYRIVG
jgi:hypothetical protein